jgi:hypothetical protein
VTRKIHLEFDLSKFAATEPRELRNTSFLLNKAVKSIANSFGAELWLKRTLCKERNVFCVEELQALRKTAEEKAAGKHWWHLWQIYERFWRSRKTHATFIQEWPTCCNGGLQHIIKSPA